MSTKIKRDRKALPRHLEHLDHINATYYPPGCQLGGNTLIGVYVHQYYFEALVPGELNQSQAAALYGRRPSMFKRISD
jgi:hypothetical protein